MPKLTPSQENYLEWIYRLSMTGPVRIGELASKMDVKLPSVTRAVQGLAKVNLVAHKSYGHIQLTDIGHRVGQAIVQRDACLTRFLVQVLGMTPENAEPEVHRLEHVFGEEVLKRLDVLLDFALSSDAWIKRLQHRISRAMRESSPGSAFRIGDADIHGGQHREKQAG